MRDWFSTASYSPVSLRDISKPLAVREDGKVSVIPSVRMPTCGEQLGDELTARVMEHELVRKRSERK